MYCPYHVLLFAHSMRPLRARHSPGKCILLDVCYKTGSSRPALTHSAEVYGPIDVYECSSAMRAQRFKTESQKSYYFRSSTMQLFA